MSTRDLILAAAIAELGVVGISDFRLARVAKAAGVTQAVIYQYFDGREGLVISAVAAWTAQAGVGRTNELADTLGPVDTFDDLAVVTSSLGNEGEVRGEESLRWALARSLVLSWHYPAHVESSEALDHSAFEAGVAMYDRLLGDANDRGAVTTRALSYFAGSVWFGAMVEVPGSDSAATEEAIGSMLVCLAQAATRSPAAVPRRPHEVSRPLLMMSFDDVQGEETRQRILTAALKEVSEVGPVRITLKNVAARAGVSSALIIHHFASRTQLLAEAGAFAIDQACHGLEAILVDPTFKITAPEDVSQLGAIVVTVGSNVDDDAAKSRRLIVEALINAQHSPTAMHDILDQAQTFVSNLAGVFERLQARDLVTRRYEAEDMAMLMFRYLWGRSLYDGREWSEGLVDELGQLGIVLYRDVFGSP